MKRVLLAALLALAAPIAAAFPDKPVRFVVGFTPGGPSDDPGARRWDRSSPSAGSSRWWSRTGPAPAATSPTAEAAKSAPDGHTWLLGNNSILATNQSLYRSLPSDPVKDFAPVALVAVQPNILVLHRRARSSVPNWCVI